MNIKVFQITDYEWWAAESAEAAVEDYLYVTGETEEYIIDRPYELNDEDMKNNFINLEDGRRITFEAYLAELIEADTAFPGMFTVAE